MTPEFRIFQSLQKHQVPFLVIGGHAVTFHGFVRSTEDLDVIWERTPHTETMLTAALLEMDAKFIGQEIDPETGIERVHPVTIAFVKSQSLMMVTTRFGFLDLFDYVPGYPDIEVASVLETSVELDGLRFISLSWLRRLKQASGRPKDLMDLKNLPEA